MISRSVWSRTALAASWLGSAACAAATAQRTNAFNCGSDTAIDARDQILYAADQPYGAGSGGYVGGDTLSWTGSGIYHGWGWLETPLYLELRGGDHAYMFDTAPGPHELTLRWIDIESNGPGMTRVEVRVDGRTLLSDLDVQRSVGQRRSLDIRRSLVLGDTTTLVEIAALEGTPALAAIALAPLAPYPRLPTPSDLAIRPTYGGALLTWDAPSPLHVDGFRVTVPASSRHLALSARRFATWAVVPADSSDQCIVELIDSAGRAGAAATLPNVAERPFDASSLPLARLYVDESDLREMERALPQKLRGAAELWVDGMLRICELNFRGMSSLELPKKSYKLRIDAGPDIEGSDILSLAAGFSDHSLARETICHDLMVAAAHPAYDAAPWRLMLNDAYAGLFTRIEDPDERYLQRIGFDPLGRSYKVHLFCEPATEIWQLINRCQNTNADDWYRRDIARLLHELETVQPLDTESWMRSTFDLDQVLGWYATQVYVENNDFMCENFILHRDRSGGAWRVLGWDVDLVLRDSSSPADLGGPDHPNDSGQVSPIADKILSTPSLKRRYLEHLENLLDGPLATPAVCAVFDRWLPLIIPEGEIDVAKISRERVAPFTRGVDELEAFLEEREGRLRESIAELIPPQQVDLAINEVADHLVGPDSIATAVELHYRGGRLFESADLCLSDDPDSLGKWPLGSLGFTEGQLQAFDLPAPLPRPSWLALSEVGAQDTVVVDSLTLPERSEEMSLGRVPDGHGRSRPLPEATLGTANSWLEPVEIVATPRREIWHSGEQLQVDLQAIANWRPSLDLELAVELIAPGGLWWSDQPIATLPLPTLQPGDTLAAWWSITLPVGLDPDRQGRYDLVFTPLERNLRYQSAVATVYLLDDPPGAALLNELCAKNMSLVADEFGEFEDWVEIVNAADSSLSTAGLYLSDDPEDDPLEWPLPALELAPGERLLIWLDDEPSEGPLHATLKLDREGEELALVQALDDSTQVLDHIVFGYQNSDWSFGRYPDAARDWEEFDAPTPDAANADPLLRY